jgi:hypothetical protein
VLVHVDVAACLTSRCRRVVNYGEERLGQGRAKAKAFLEERPDLLETAAADVRVLP